VENDQVDIQERKNVTIIRDIHLNLETTHVLRREGIRQNGPVRPEIVTLIDELLADIKDGHLLEPAIAYEIYPIIEIDQRKISLSNNKALHSPFLASVLLNARELAVVICTIGSKLEKRVTDLLDRGEPLQGMLLDGIGSAAVDSLSQEACKFITGVTSPRGYQASSPFSPGMYGFPITEQQQLFQLISAEQIGVTLTVTGLMVPLKSVSMVVGIGQGMTVRTQAEVCASCNLNRTCNYRFESKKENNSQFASAEK
jgi:hypothetical protein